MFTIKNKLVLVSSQWFLESMDNSFLILEDLQIASVIHYKQFLLHSSLRTDYICVSFPDT